MSLHKFKQLRVLLDSQLCTKFSISNDLICFAFAIQNELRTYYFDFATAQITTLPLLLPSIPNFDGRRSSRVTAISSVPLPTSDDEISCIVLGLDNGVALILNEELELIAVFVPPRGLGSSPVLQILSSAASRFNTSYFLSFRFKERVFAFSLSDVLGCIFEPVTLTEQTDVIASEAHLLFRGAAQTTAWPLAQYVCYDIAGIDRTCLVYASDFVFEQTNLLQIAARPLLVKYVPFFDKIHGNAQVPLEIKLVAAEVEFTSQTPITVNGDGFSYVISPSLTQKPLIGALYAGPYFVDKLDIAAGYLAGDVVPGSEECRSPEPASDLGLVRKKGNRQQGYAEKTMRIAFALWAVENLPHVVCVTADGAILNIRADTMDIIACSYALDTTGGEIIGILCQREGNLLIILQQNGEKTRKTEFELPSLMFKGVHDTSYSTFLDFTQHQFILSFTPPDELVESTSESISHDYDEIVITRQQLGQ